MRKKKGPFTRPLSRFGFQPASVALAGLRTLVGEFQIDLLATARQHCAAVLGLQRTSGRLCRRGSHAIGGRRRRFRLHAHGSSGLVTHADIGRFVLAEEVDMHDGIVGAAIGCLRGDRRRHFCNGRCGCLCRRIGIAFGGGGFGFVACRKRQHGQRGDQEKLFLHRCKTLPQLCFSGK